MTAFTETAYAVDADVALLEQMEEAIRRDENGFIDAGTALRTINEKRLYKLKNGGMYKTFEAYCKDVWRISRPRAYQLIESVKVVENLSTSLSTCVEKTDLKEFVVRPLAELKCPEAQVAAFQEAKRHADIERREVTARHVKVAMEPLLTENVTKFSPIIKPSDNWNFSTIYYGRVGIDDGEGQESHGYIPGDVYPNALWYYTKPGDIVVEPMAGSGQIWRVWEERRHWMRPKPWDLDIRTFDLTPRGPYKDRIAKWDLTEGFPVARADYVFMDVPYFGMVDGQYSSHDADLANQKLADWLSSIQKIARSCASGQSSGGLCSVMTPNWRDTDDGEIIMTADMARQAFVDAGYVLFDKAYSSRRVQQTQGPRAAELNIKAKENKTMLTDISEIMTFRKV
jgi:ParB family chromosome partitioning protein